MQFGRILLPPSSSFICFINGGFVAYSFSGEKSRLLKKLKSILKNTSDMPSQVFLALKHKFLLNASHCWSWATSRARSSLDIFSNPLNRLSWDSRKNKLYKGPWLTQKEPRPTCPENKPNTPSQNALLIKYRKCQQDHKDVFFKVDEQPVFCFDYGFWLLSEQRKAQEHKAVLYGHPYPNIGPEWQLWKHLCLS